MNPAIILTTLLPVLDISIKVAFLITAASLASHLLRRAPAATRHLIWLSALAAAALLPAGSLLVPASYGARWRIPITVPTPLPIPSPTVSSPEGPGPIPVDAFSKTPYADPDPRRNSTVLAADNAATDTPENPIAPARVVLVLYLMGMVTVLLQVFSSWLSVRHLSLAASAAAPESMPAIAFGAAREEMGDAGAARIQLLLLPECVPMTWGWRRPAILLPADAEAWEPGRLRVVLLHEVAHITRRDWPIQIAANLICALYWFHPLVWWAAARLRAESESACDDRVLLAGVAAETYAEHLLAVARLSRRLLGGGALDFATPMARPGGLRPRILAILDGRLSRFPARYRLQYRIAVATTAALATSACLLRLSTVVNGQRPGPRIHPTPIMVRQPAYAYDGVHNRVRFADGRVVDRDDLLRPLEDLPPNAAWTNHFPHGISVELAALSEPHDPHAIATTRYANTFFWGPDPVPTTLWNSWRPEGTPLAQPIYDPIDPHLISFPNPEVNRAVEFNLRITGAKTHDVWLNGYAAESRGAGGLAAYPSDQYQPTREMLAMGTAFLAKQTEYSDIYVGIAPGPADHLYEFPRSRWVSQDDVMSHPARLPHDGQSVHVSRPERNGGGYIVWILDTVRAPNYRIWAIDRHGKRHGFSSWNGASADGRLSGLFVYENDLPLQNLDHIEFETRTFEYTVFHHVALYSGSVGR